MSKKMSKTQHRSFVCEVTSVSRVRSLLDASGDVADELVMVACERRGGSGVSWVCHEDEAPTVGTMARVTVEVMA